MLRGSGDGNLGVPLQGDRDAGELCGASYLKRSKFGRFDHQSAPAPNPSLKDRNKRKRWHWPQKRIREMPQIPIWPYLLNWGIKITPGQGVQGNRRNERHRFTSAS